MGRKFPIEPIHCIEEDQERTCMGEVSRDPCKMSDIAFFTISILFSYSAVFAQTAHCLKTMLNMDLECSVQ